MATKLYVLISWPDGSRVINMENIKEPRKPFHQYEVGEQVLTRCPGFSGLYWGTVEGISEHKGLLEKRLQKDKELLIREEQPAVQNVGLPQPKRSRKSFPKWNPGNGVKACQESRTFQMDMEDTKANQQDAATSSGLREGYPLGAMMPKSHSSEPVASHASGPFHASSPFSTIFAPGVSQRGAARSDPASKDYSTMGARRKSDLPHHCQKYIFVNSCDESKSTSSLEMDGFEVVQKAFEMERQEACISRRSPPSVGFPDAMSLLDSSREDKIEQLQQMVFDLQREVLSLKQKVQHLEATSLKEEGPICQQPCKESERFNGYTREQLKEAIRFDQKISTACKTLLYKLFTSEYIQNHSITGRRGNTFREAKPMMDERCIKIIRVLLKQKFGDHLSDTVITEKIQNVQKALRQKCKMECL